MEETDRASLPRVTATVSENGTGVSNDGSQQRTEESHKRDEGVQQRGQQHLPPRGEASRSEKDMAETLRVAQPQTHRTSGTNGQTIRQEVFQVGVRGQQHTQKQTKCISCGLWGVRLSVDTERSSFTCKPGVCVGGSWIKLQPSDVRNPRRSRDAGAERRGLRRREILHPLERERIATAD